MKDTPREVKIWKIVEKDLPDDIGITAQEYDYVGWQYRFGMGVLKADLKLACKCYERAAKMGNAKSMISLAEIYYESCDLEEYYKWILEASFGGENPDAFYRLGEMYFKGEYVRQDYEKAYKYFDLACSGGAEGAKYYIAYYAENGIIAPKDKKKAIIYYIGGAKEYDDRCLKRLAELNIEY